MKKNDPKYDYSRVGEEYKDEELINLKTGQKELIRIPIGRSIRETPIIPYHVNEHVYNSWKNMKTCEFPQKIQSI